MVTYQLPPTLIHQYNISVKSVNYDYQVSIMMYYEVFNITTIWLIYKIFVTVADTPLLSVAIHIYYQAVKSTQQVTMLVMYFL